MLTSWVMAEETPSLRLCANGDTTYYSAFADALKIANRAPEAQMTLLGDVTFEGAARAQSIRTNLTIDLNGYALGDTLCETPNTTTLLSLGVDTLTLHLTSSRPGGRLWVTRAVNSRIYPVSVSKGHLIVDSLTIEAVNSADSTMRNAAATGVSVGSRGTLQIKDCQVSVTSSGAGTGISASGDKNAVSKAMIERCRVTVNAHRNTYGITAYSHVSIADCEVNVRIDSTTAYGISINHSDTSLHLTDQATVVRTHIDVTAKQSARGLTSRCPLTMTDDTIRVAATFKDAYAYHSYHADAPCVAQRCLFDADARHITAYGAYVQIGSMTAEDCVFRSECHMDEADTLLNANARGVTVSNNMSASLRRCTIRAIGQSDYSQSVIALTGTATSRLTARDCNLEAQGSVRVYGVNCYDNADIDSCHIRVNAQKSAYAFYTNGSIHLISDTLTAVAAEESAYAFYVAREVDSVRLDDCMLKAEAPEKAYVVNKNAKMEGKMWFYNGYYSLSENLPMYIPPAYGLYHLTSGAEAAAGYAYVIRPISNPGVEVARVYNTTTGALQQSFTSVAEALRFVQFEVTPSTIVVVANCQLNADANGNKFYIGEDMSLVVGCEENQKTAIGTPARRLTESGNKRMEFARLEVMDNVRIIVDPGGMIEVSAAQQKEESVLGTVGGAYGRIHMAPTASIELDAGSELFGWGYITGQGTITAKRGAIVHEFVQFGDWKGGQVTQPMINNPQRVFPITHFFYQNIECPIIYYAGSQALGSAVIAAGGFIGTHDEVRIVDSHNALFVIPSNADDETFLRKEYDAAHDRVNWTISGDISLEELSVPVDNSILSNYSLLSTRYVLPIGSNNTIRVASGQLSFPHDIVFLPGSVLEVAPEAQLHIPLNTRLYLYDEAEWGSYNNRRYATVTYSPSWKTCPRDTVLVSARLHVGGTVQVEGALYTTASGAEITGEDSTAQVVFVHGAASNDVINQLTGVFESRHYTAQPVTSAALRNDDGSLRQTIDAEIGEAFIHKNGFWRSINDPDTMLTDLNTTSLSERHLHGRVIIRHNTPYILLPDGRMYTILGIPAKKED